MAIETEYRIVTKRTFCGDRYLQFKSKKVVRSFPFFWKKKQIECWRFIPGKDLHIFGYINEEACPTALSSFGEGHYLNCFHGNEDLEIGGLIPLTRKFSDIQEYFREMNRMRDEYLEDERRANTAGTTYI